jgi:hypothetical protein
MSPKSLKKIPQKHGRAFETRHVFVGRENSRGATHIGVYTPNLFLLYSVVYVKSVAHSTTHLIGASSHGTESLLSFPKR